MTKILLEIEMADAETLRDSMADVICWCRGFNAGRPEHVDGPIPSSVDAISTHNYRLKAAIDKAMGK